MNENIDEINSLHDYYIKQLQNQDDKMGTMQKEIDRLNNIINELEKWLNEKEESSWDDYYSAIVDVSYQLQELKEQNND